MTNNILSSINPSPIAPKITHVVIIPIQNSPNFSYTFGDIYELDIHDLQNYNSKTLATFYEIYAPRLEYRIRDIIDIKAPLIYNISQFLKENDYRIITIIIKNIAETCSGKKYIINQEVELHHGFVDDEAILTIKLNKRLFRISSNGEITRKMHGRLETFILDSNAIDRYITLSEFEYLTFIINEYKIITHNWHCYGHYMFTLKKEVENNSSIFETADY